MNPLQQSVALLAAALKHAKQHKSTPHERRAYAVFFLQCVERDYIKARRYSQAVQVRSVINLCATEPVLTSLLARLRLEAGDQDTDREGPASNTGPTEGGISENALETYVSGRGQ